jgi:hypothetical protein
MALDSGGLTGHPEILRDAPSLWVRAWSPRDRNVRSYSGSPISPTFPFRSICSDT